MSRQLLIIGAGEFGDIAYEYFTVDSDYEVVGFAVEAEFLSETEKFGLPVVTLEDAPAQFPPDQIHAHVAVTSTKLNRVRARLIGVAREQGYHLASFISPKTFVWRTAEIGENAFVFENNVIQHGVRIGDGCVIWSGNHIGHQSKIGDYCFLSSHVVISGYCTIGRHCFVGVNASFADEIEVGDDCFVGMAAVVNKNFPDAGLILNGNPAEPSRVTAYRYFRIEV